MGTAYDAVVVGAGPNGLAAAIEIARAGRSVLLIEAADEVGGGARSAELTLPGFVHDVCSAVHPLALASPFFRSIPNLGVEWIQPALPLAHPLDDGSAAVLDRSLDETARGLGADGAAWRRHLGVDVHAIIDHVLGPLVRLPRHPFAMARFGLGAIRSARSLATRAFDGEPARAIFAGMAAHSILPLEQSGTAGIGLLLGALAHSVGWPVPRGGSGSIARALESHLRTLGGEIECGRRVRSLRELPAARAYLLDTDLRQAVTIAGDRFPPSYRRKLERFRHGPAVFKVDWALDGPIPWKADACARAGTVHVGGSFDEIAAGEAAVWRGEHPARPFVILAQQSMFDPTRAPPGKHVIWAYCHVPNGSTVDMTQRIEEQVERFAPGFRERILAKHVMTPADVQSHDANYIGGDITGGVSDLRQLIARPILSMDPYATPAKDVFLCSSSTPPGAGVHGMCGRNAGRSALRVAVR